MKKPLFRLHVVIEITAASLWFILLFLVSINVLYRINEAVILLFIGTIIYTAWYRHKFQINLEMLLLFMFGTAYFMIYIQYMPYSPRTYVSFWLGPPIMYLIGHMFLSKRNAHLLKWILFTIVFGLFTYGFLNMLPYFGDMTGYPDIRIAYDFWEGYWVVATLEGIYFTGVSALLIYNLMHMGIKKAWYLKLIHFAALGFSAYFSILLENRTFFFLTAIVFALALLVELLLSKLKFYIPLAISIVFLAIVYYTYKYDVFGIQTFIVSTDWYNRFTTMLAAGIENDPRIPIYGLFKRQFLEYPLGGFQMDINGLDYAHNLWIDVYYAVGIYPFIMLVLYSLLTISTIVRVLLSKVIKKDMKILLFSLFIAYTINFMTEPILEGVPYIFMLYCLINGLTYKYLRIKQEEYKVSL